MRLIKSGKSLGAGEKLIEHLKNWLEPEKLVRPDCAWAAGEAPTIAAAILNLFHLLPKQAVQFLETNSACPIHMDRCIEL